MIKEKLRVYHHICPLTTYTIIDATIDGVDFFNFRFLPKNKRAQIYALKRLDELIREFIELEVIETDPLTELERRDKVLAKRTSRTGHY
jgi:hypothetical protein